MDVQLAQEYPNDSTAEGKEVVMRRLPLCSRVRRRLFSDELAKDLNLACAKTLRDDSVVLAVKWNFDFEKEVPMEGPIKWYRKDGDTWYGMLASGKTTTITPGKMTPDEDLNMTEIQLRRANVSLPVHSRARRRLFLDEMENAKQCSSIENALNNIMEETHMQKKLQWNFDFQTEEPLEGPIQWFRKEKGGWIAMVPVKEEEAETMAAEADRGTGLDDSTESTVEVVDNAVIPADDKVDGSTQSADNDSISTPVPDVADQDVEMMELPIENVTTDEVTPDIDNDGPMASMEIQNQETPRNDRAEVLPQIRKRKREVVTVNRAKKRISFF